MDDIPLCPLYWPELTWRLLHKFPHPPDPDPDPVYRTDLFKRLDSHFAALAVEALTSRFESVELGEQISKLAEQVAGPRPDPWRSAGELSTAGR
jgi:hypothetical protein